MENLAPITEAQDVPTKQYVDDGLAGKADASHTHPGGGGDGSHSSLINLDADDHGQYAPIHVIDAADPDPTDYQRPGQIVVRKGVAVNEGLEFLQKQGGTMTGPLILQGGPSNALEAVPRFYVDPTGLGDTGWQSLVPYLVSPAASHSATWTPHWRLRNGWMQFRGLLQCTSAMAANAKIANNPYPPKQVGGYANGHHFVCKGGYSGDMGIRVETGGDIDLIEAWTAGAGYWLSLDTIGYWID